MLKLNCGLSYSEQSAEDELKKIELANKYGIDYVSIISIDEERTKWFWELVSDHFNWNNSVSVKPQANFKLCSAPLYESVMFNESIMDTIKRHYSYGVRAMTFHVTPVELINDAIISIATQDYSKLLPKIKEALPDLIRIVLGCLTNANATEDGPKLTFDFRTSPYIKTECNKCPKSGSLFCRYNCSGK